MDKIKIIIGGLLFLSFISCDSMLDNDFETDLKPEQVFVNYERMRSVANGAYTYLDMVAGFYHMNGSLRAATTDEAAEASYNPQVQKFNLGIWNQYSNPDDIYNKSYKAIRQCNIFLDGSEDYRIILATDTITATGKANYKKNCEDIDWYRQEVRFLRAFYYFELIKRYGGVPIITEVLNQDDEIKIPRSEFDDCIFFIVDELNDVVNKVAVDMTADRHGRVTRGAVMALASRVLLYAASSQNNPSMDQLKWIVAAKSANDIIKMNKYSLHDNYQNLFLAPNSYNSSEVIMYHRYTTSNVLEKANYPIGTPGGKSGVSPSQNLVDAYEKLANWSEALPYSNVDPRLAMTIVTNNTFWNGRMIESYVDGKDGLDKPNASPTGYYLKKFLSPNLNLSSSPAEVTMKSWILFRYAEVLLNYAEAMNEAYGPTVVPSDFKMSALAAINIVRSRVGVELPKLTTTNKDQLREAIYIERQVELAFEDHRMWDLRRWNRGVLLSEDIRGVIATKDVIANKYTYEYTSVQKRVFDESKMYLYPIPQSEINKQPSILKQNPNW